MRMGGCECRSAFSGVMLIEPHTPLGSLCRVHRKTEYGAVGLPSSRDPPVFQHTLTVSLVLLLLVARWES